MKNRTVPALSALLCGALVALGVAAPPASADTSPPVGVPATVSADGLPTVQINGVVWKTAIVGGTAYAVGSFTKARPAGVAAGGSGEVVRNNILAFDVATGNLLPFNPSLSAQALTIKASPDGKKIYVGGDFTTVNGQVRNKVAAFSTADGTLDASFAPTVSAQVRALAVTDTAVYAGGNFFKANNVARTRLAAFNRTSGALLPWAPVADDNQVEALAVSPADPSRVIVGGRFQKLNGQAQVGVGAVDATTGGTAAWSSRPVPTTLDPKTATSWVTDLEVQGDTVYGSADGEGGHWYDGRFAAKFADGALVWLDNCYGATYGIYPAGDTVYSVSHAHDCASLSAFADTSPTTWHRTLAETAVPVGTDPAPRGSNGNYEHQPVPGLLHWFPTLGVGSVTGQYQAAWTVTGNSQYLVEGGEFPSVNGVAQQGLVRFTLPANAPKKIKPVYSAALVPTATSLQAGTIRVAWPATWDPDNSALRYDLYRDSGTVPVFSQAQSASAWTTTNPSVPTGPAMGYVDTGLANGSSHTYRLKVSDQDGNNLDNIRSNSTTVSSTPQSTYAKAVAADGASNFWRLGETGTTAFDYAGYNDATSNTGVTGGAAGAIGGDSNAASTFDGAAGAVVARSQSPAPSSFSLEGWFRTTSTSGGKIIGYGDRTDGPSSNYDRHLYLDNAGRVIFGVNGAGVRTVASPAGLNDGQYHQVVATLDAVAGVVLYVDGKRVARDTSARSGQAFTGYWKIGGDNLNGWPSQPASNYLAGTIDDIAVYPTALSASAVDNHYVASGRPSTVPVAPADAYGKAVFGDSPASYWRLNDGSSTVAADSGPARSDGSYTGAVTPGGPSAVGATADRSATLDGLSAGVAGQQTGTPTAYSEEMWFKTATTQGGKLIGFGNAQTGPSSGYDRHVYMQNDGRLVFGTYTNTTNVVTTKLAYNDDSWHHLVATQGSDGMKLYLDATLTASNAQSSAQPYDGYWRVGGDNVGGWPNRPSSDYFAGAVDDVAIYDRVLSASTITSHYTATGRTVAAPVVPTDAYGKSVVADAPDMFWRLGESGGTIARDSGAGGNDGSYTGSVVLGRAGAVKGTTNTAATFDGANGAVYANQTVDNPTTYSEELWFQTTTTSGGKLIGFGTSQIGPSNHYDRHVYMQDDGALVFGAYTGDTTRITTGSAYNDGGWHHMVATQGSDGMKLYVDGQLAGTDPHTSSEAESGYWRAGGDSTWGSSSAYFAGTLDEIAVYPTVLPAGRVAAHFAAGSSSTPANQPPVAHLATTCTDLSCSADASASTDADGSVSSYAFDFGDGSAPVTGSGAASHVYSAAGTYTVKVTVTDNAGATGTDTSSVTVTKPANHAPVAGLTVSCVYLDCAADGSGSSDQDGTITSYALDFGDGSPVVVQAGAKASHHYGAAGTYPVTVTVTDNDGARATSSATATAKAVPYAQDAFSRTVSSGWGNADTGGPWSVAGTAASLAVNGDAGLLKLTAAGAGPTGYLDGVKATDSDTSVTVSLDKAPTGNGTYVYVLGRRVSTADYRASVRFTNTGGVGVSLLSRQSGTDTVVAGEVMLPGLTYTPGASLRVRLQVAGTGTSTLRVRVWPATSPEPSAWAQTGTSTTAALQAAGGVGLGGYLSGSSTSAPTVVRFDDLISTPVT